MEPRDQLADGETDAEAEGAAAKPKKPEPVRTAMSIEIRDGVLCAFMPPVEMVEDYLELITAVEAGAEEMQLPVHVEGYSPPYDPRVEVIKVTPDPGVIEMNIQPSHKTGPRWPSILPPGFTSAHQTRLGANRSLSTAATPAPAAATTSCWAARDQGPPLLRRPDLLRLPADYWQRHPSLSYLFAGGSSDRPSQAPRVDEARPMHSTNWRSRSPDRAAARRRARAVADRPGVPTPAHRYHRQHPPRRVLHRQALSPRQRPRPARPARTARLRDAARTPRMAMVQSAPGAVDWSHGSGTTRCARRDPARGTTCTVDTCCRTSSFTTSPTSRRTCAQPVSHSTPAGSTRSPSSGSRASDRVFDGVEIDAARRIEPWHVLGEESDRRRHRALRRLLGRAHPGASHRAPTGTLRHYLQRPADADHRNRPVR